MTLRQNSRAGRFIRYGAVGLLTNAGAYAIFLGLIAFQTPPVLASGAVYLLVISISYVANYSWSFKSQERHTRELSRYLLSYLVGFVVAMGLMAVLVNWVSPAIAQLVVICITAIVIFSCLELLKFGQKRG